VIVDARTEGHVGRRTDIDGVRVVNGPEDQDLEWGAVDWRAAEDEVRRLRRRIFTASRDGDHKRVRNLQRLMLRSRSNTLISVRRVTERNAGRATAGIDGETALASPARAVLAMEIHRRDRPWRARPVKRVFIPKSKQWEAASAGDSGTA
jgi:RNA-directed DNA polymerase